MALVLTAVAAEGLSQNSQALEAYKKAVQIDDSQILAWQVIFYVQSALLVMEKNLLHYLRDTLKVLAVSSEKHGKIKPEKTR